MQTHNDTDFMRRLKERAEEMEREGKSQITAGKPDEKPIAKWLWAGIQVMHMPDDEQGITRISIGGGDHIGEGKFDYCTIRGSVSSSIRLLEKALVALKEVPDGEIETL